jgi:hypothetical protein
MGPATSAGNQARVAPQNEPPAERSKTQLFNATFTTSGPGAGPRWCSGRVARPQAAGGVRYRPIGSSVTDVTLAGLDQPTLEGEDHHLGAVAQAELGEDARHMRLHGRRPDEQLLGDLGVAGSPRDRNQDLALPVGETVQAATIWSPPAKGTSVADCPPVRPRRLGRASSQRRTHGDGWYGLSSCRR